MAVRVVAPEKDRGAHDPSDALRVVVPALQRVLPEFAHTTVLGLLETRAGDDIGEDLKARLKVLLQHGERDDGSVEPCACRKARAKIFERGRDRDCAARTSPFVEHVGGDVREARAAVGVVRRAGRDHQSDRHERQCRARNETHRQAFLRLEDLGSDRL